MERGDARSLAKGLSDAIRNFGIDPLALVSEGELPVIEKYDRYIPAELLRRAYATDKLDVGKAAERIVEMGEEFNRDPQ